MKEKLKKAAQIFGFYVRIGCFTFGGGYSIIAQMQKEFVEERKMITDEELLDITSVGRSLPGTMIGNVSFLFGYHIGGVVCGLAAMLGIIFWPFIILSIVTMIYTRVLDNVFVARALVGIRASVVPIIFAATRSLSRQALKDKLCYGFMLIAFCLCLFRVNNIAIVLLGGALGLICKGVFRNDEVH